jgi:hypothetical protein
MGFLKGISFWWWSSLIWLILGALDGSIGGYFACMYGGLILVKMERNNAN